MTISISLRDNIFLGDYQVIRTDEVIPDSDHGNDVEDDVAPEDNYQTETTTEKETIDPIAEENISNTCRSKIFIEKKNTSMLKLSEDSTIQELTHDSQKFVTTASIFSR